ncbi:MAG: hypothetical protein SPF16_04300, partial [Prevotella sp.]|nr:hypothetical protein [Prevotella sp.]
TPGKRVTGKTGSQVRILFSPHPSSAYSFPPVGGELFCVFCILVAHTSGGAVDNAKLTARCPHRRLRLPLPSLFDENTTISLFHFFTFSLFHLFDFDENTTISPFHLFNF